MPKLYDYVLSGSCYKVRLLLSMLGIAYEAQAVDFFPGRAHKQPDFLALNPLGQLPVFEDEGLVLRDAQAILCHLANKYDTSGQWLPRDERFGPAMMWLSFAGGELMAISGARMIAMLNYPGDLAALQAKARTALRLLDDHLADRAQAGKLWIVGETPTIADIATFPYVALSHDAGIGHEDYPAINLWQRQVRKLPGFVGMPGVPDYF
ncbi:MAG TPA: glutathione S-transferase family protein [Devosia sp.]|jgi:glutathione S-transferase|uniref:glutathione S-transferase family protein n=1 Tax=Devosia sp. TaxID=1871048 RepID=UPI002DDD8A9C|nr:glutathione S-transferase family protein [Devosia sp.]HEV2516700.1 glutathione S-transferase family protein [Devosia sp.]